MKTLPKDLAAAAGSDWEQKALLAVCEYANSHLGENHLAEEIRAFAEGNGVARLKDARAWGPTLKKAEKHGIIKRVGFAPTVSSNGSPKVLWEMVGVLPVVSVRPVQDK